jgi:hypothetical protein
VGGRDDPGHDGCQVRRVAGGTVAGFPTGVGKRFEALTGCLLFSRNFLFDVLESVTFTDTDNATTLLFRLEFK